MGICLHSQASWRCPNSGNFSSIFLDIRNKAGGQPRFSSNKRWRPPVLTVVIGPPVNHRGDDGQEAQILLKGDPFLEQTILAQSSDHFVSSLMGTQINEMSSVFSPFLGPVLSRNRDSAEMWGTAAGLSVFTTWPMTPTAGLHLIFGLHLKNPLPNSLVFTHQILQADPRD